MVHVAHHWGEPSLIISQHDWALMLISMLENLIVAVVDLGLKFAIWSNGAIHLQAISLTMKTWKALLGDEIPTCGQDCKSPNVL